MPRRLLQSRALRLLVPAVLLLGTAGAIGLHALRSGGGIHLSCGRSDGNGLTEWMTTTCDSAAVTLGPGVYHLAARFSACTGYHVALTSDVPMQPLVVGTPVTDPLGRTEGPAVAGNQADFALSRDRHLTVTGQGAVLAIPERFADNRQCHIDVAVTRTGAWGVAQQTPPTQVACAATGHSIPAFSTNTAVSASSDLFLQWTWAGQAPQWTVPHPACAQTVTLAPGDYETDATLADCGGGISWGLGDQTGQAAARSDAITIGSDEAAAGAAAGVHTTRVHGELHSLQSRTWGLSIASRPRASAYDNAACAIRVAIAPAGSTSTPQPPASTSAAQPASAPPVSMSLPPGSSTRTLPLRAGTYWLDAGPTPSACTWSLSIHGVIAANMIHPAEGGITVGPSEGRSAEVVVPSNGSYPLQLRSECALEVHLTWVTRPEPPLRTGPAAPNQF